MDTDERCNRLAGEIRNILTNDITLGNEVIHYIDSTFSNPTAAELQSIIQDDFNCEKDSLIELLMFPDETMQLQLELLLERLRCKKEDEKLVVDKLLKDPLRVTIRFPTDREAVRLTVTEEAARLNLDYVFRP